MKSLIQMAQEVKPQSVSHFIQEAFTAQGINLGVRGIARIKRNWEESGVLPEIVTNHLMRVILQTPRGYRYATHKRNGG